MRRTVGLWSLRVHARLPSNLSLSHTHALLIMCITWALCSTCCVTNALSIPCTQSARRYLDNNQFTGSVEALGKLSKLTTLCVGELGYGYCACVYTYQPPTKPALSLDRGCVCARVCWYAAYLRVGTLCARYWFTNTFTPCTQSNYQEPSQQPVNRKYRGAWQARQVN